jgi:hypothetical protein
MAVISAKPVTMVHLLMHQGIEKMPAPTGEGMGGGAGGGGDGGVRSAAVEGQDGGAQCVAGAEVRLGQWAPLQ